MEFNESILEALTKVHENEWTFMEVKINISLKQGVLDPQGRAVESALISLGYSEANNVRIGKQITLEIEAEDASRAQQRAARMCETLLANTVIEDYSIEVADPS